MKSKIINSLPVTTTALDPLAKYYTDLSRSTKMADTDMACASETRTQGMIDPAIFAHLQSKIDEDIEVREQLRNVLQDLEKQGGHY